MFLFLHIGDGLTIFKKTKENNFSIFVMQGFHELKEAFCE